MLRSLVGSEMCIRDRYMTGGDLSSLTGGGSRCVGNTIQQYSRWYRTYNPGVGFGGFRNVYSHNSIADAPHQAFCGSGNDMVFEHNLVSQIGFETDDSGSFYTGYSWAHRGNVIRYNYFEDIRTDIEGGSVQAVYQDRQMSGYAIYGNTFLNCDCGVYIGGGRDHEVFNNSFVRVDLPVHIDNRGMGPHRASCSPGGPFELELMSYNYQQPPWSTHYPFLVGIMHEHPCVPVNNRVYNNTFCQPRPNFTDVTPVDAAAWMDVFEQNVAVGC
eukprot:TRINITY_DN15489_c0_g1_i2.p1 TRINITY_DN15489_c0_g1~~TRINITY_DN15489_c0_g1_i2.p1  ORF type:complete len:311 (+),score=57.56 TRINITY_DN15489_c0_g1_i2:122-934(+)